MCQTVSMAIVASLFGMYIYHVHSECQIVWIW